VRMHFGNVVVKGESGCNLLGLLGACAFLRLPVFCCIFGAELSPVASLSNVELFGFLCLILCMFYG